MTMETLRVLNRIRICTLVVFLMPFSYQVQSTPNTTAKPDSDSTMVIENKPMVKEGSPREITLTLKKSAEQPTTLVELNTNVDFSCGAYWIYFKGKNAPGPAALEWKKLKEGEVPIAIRLRTENDKGDYWSAYLNESLCGESIKLSSTDEQGRFYLLSGQPAVGASKPQPPATDCLGGCSTCDGVAKYRLVYDVSTNEVCAQRWKRPTAKHAGGWLALNDRIIRPGVNKLLDVKFVNYNALRDSISLAYSFEDLNMENGDEFVNALLTPAATPTKADQGTGDGDGDGEGTADDDTDSTDTEASSERISPPPGAPERTRDKAYYGKQMKSIKELSDLIEEESGKDLKEGVNMKALAEAKGYAGDAGVEWDLGEDDYPGQLSATLDSAVAYKVEGLANEDQRKTWEANLDMTEKEYDTLSVKLDLMQFDTLQKEVIALYKKAKDATVTPDLTQVRGELIDLFKARLPDRFTSFDGSSIKTNSQELIDEALTMKLIDDDKKRELEEQAKKMQEAFDELMEYRTYLLAPIQMQDYDRLNLQFKLDGQPLNATPYRVHASGGWKVDFSTGVVFTDLRDRQFFYSSIRSDTTVVPGVADTTIVGTDTTITVPTTENVTRYGTVSGSTTDESQWGLAVLAHFYPRTGTILNASITLGALVRQDGVSLLLGGSLLCGRKHRFALTYGGILGNVQRLKPGYSEGGEYTVDQNTGVNTIVPQTEDQMRWGGFVGITYNFAGAKITR